MRLALGKTASQTPGLCTRHLLLCVRTGAGVGRPKCMALNQKTDSRILLVDDDALQVRMRAAVLRDAGFQVLIATSAEAAMALFRVNSPSAKVDAILTDHLMSGASGAEFARSVRRIRPAVPIVVLTGLITAEPEYAGLNVTFLVKPVPPDELIFKIKSLLASAAAA